MTATPSDEEEDVCPCGLGPAVSAGISDAELPPAVGGVEPSLPQPPGDDDGDGEDEIGAATSDEDLPPAVGGVGR